MIYSGSDKQIQRIRSDRVPEKLWTEGHDIVQKAVFKTIHKKKEMQNGILRRPYKSLRNEEKLKAKEKRKDIPI